MADRIELNNNEETHEESVSPLMEETMRERMRVTDRVGISEAEDKALTAAVNAIFAIQNKLAELPEAVRREFLTGIQGMSGDNFPAFDALKKTLVKTA